ncbi:hypothetical protein GQ457_03G032380 [Hibiscus cannabinus]
MKLNKVHRSCNVLHAKLWGVLESISLAWHLGVDRLTVQLNNVDVYRLFKLLSTMSHFVLVRSIFFLLDRVWVVKIMFVSREAYMPTDMMVI